MPALLSLLLPGASTQEVPQADGLRLDLPGVRLVLSQGQWSRQDNQESKIKPGFHSIVETLF